MPTSNAAAHGADSGLNGRPRGHEDPGPPRSRVTQVAWLAHVDLTLDEWRALGARLGATSRSSNWWVGDWVRYGTAKHGQKYAAAARVTGYDEQTLSNMVYVANRFEISRRREKVSWSHHAELAGLDEPEQERWLDRTVAENLKVRELRSLLREVRRTRASTGRESAGASSSATEVTAATEARLSRCPQCGYDLSSRTAGAMTSASLVGPQMLGAATPFIQSKVAEES